MAIQTIRVGPEEVFVLSRKDFEELMEKAGILPPFPPFDANGTCDAIAASEVSIAREVISRRIAAGLTQTELAKRAGVRLETISRLEAAKHVPRYETVVRIDNALKQVEGAGRSRARGKPSRRCT